MRHISHLHFTLSYRQDDQQGQGLAQELVSLNAHLDIEDTNNTAAAPVSVPYLHHMHCVVSANAVLEQDTGRPCHQAREEEAKPGAMSMSKNIGMIELHSQSSKHTPAQAVAK